MRHTFSSQDNLSKGNFVFLTYYFVDVVSLRPTKAITGVIIGICPIVTPSGVSKDKVFFHS
jgi:hypothetical protein